MISFLFKLSVFKVCIMRLAPWAEQLFLKDRCKRFWTNITSVCSNCKCRNRLHPQVCTAMRNVFSVHCRNSHSAELRTAVAANWHNLWFWDQRISTPTRNAPSLHCRGSVRARPYWFGFQVYWLPWSELKISGFPKRSIAILNVSTQWKASISYWPHYTPSIYGWTSLLRRWQMPGAHQLPYK